MNNIGKINTGTLVILKATSDQAYGPMYPGYVKKQQTIWVMRTSWKSKQNKATTPTLAQVINTHHCIWNI